MKKAFVMIMTGLIASALLLTALSYIVYGRSPQATVYEWMLRRRYASHRTAEEEAERLRKRARKDEPTYELPEDLKFQSDIQEIDWHGLQVFALNPEARAVTAVYLHGGAYINPFNEYQWRFMDRLASEAGVCVLAPAYHLAPWGDCARAYDDLTAFFAALGESNPGSKLLLMGDSAGGGLALGLAQQLARAGGPMPERLILFSPWVDVSMENPDIADYIGADPILHLELMKVHGILWAGDLGVGDSRVSPLRGDMTGLPPVTLYCGTRELLCPDILLAAEKMEAAGVDIDLRLGQGLNHDYPLMPIPEGRAAVREVIEMARTP